jgi:hypothetical protein
LVMQYLAPRNPSNGLRCSEMAAESEIAELADKATQELRLAWLKLYRKEFMVEVLSQF